MLNKKYRVLLVHATVCLFLVLAGGCAPRNASGDHVDNLGYALQLTPAAPTVTTGHTLPFTATAPWGKDANWAVLPSAAGTIDGQGLFTAGPTLGTCRVTAMWKGDVRYTAAATVTVVAAPAPAVTPAAATLTVNGTGTASVPDQAGCSYLWTVQGGTLLQGQGTPAIQFSASSLGPVSLSCAVTNSAGDVATSTTTVASVDIVPAIAYQPDTFTFTLGQAIAPMVPSATGGPVVTWSIAPQLPPGLSLDPGTGTISGIPTAGYPATTFTVTAANSGGSSTADLHLKVAVMPVIAYTPSTLILTKGQAMTGLIPSNGGGAATIWTLRPALPAGLAFDTATGRIGGTAAVLAEQAVYTVVASNSGGDSIPAPLTLTVVDTPPVIACAPLALTVTRGPAIPSLTPVDSGGPATRWTAAPALPQGLTLDALTGQVTGAVAAPAGTYTWTLTASNSGGTSNPLAFRLDVVAPPSASGLTASTASPLHGAPVTLTPLFSDGTGVLDHGIGPVTSGTAYPTENLSAPATFALTVTNAAGLTDTRSVAVTPQAVAISPVTVAGGNGSASVGLTRVVRATVTGAADATVQWSATAGSFSPAVTASGADTVWTAPANAGACSLTAASTAVPSVQASTAIAVVPLPTASSLNPSTPNPLYGATVTLTPQFASGTGTVDPGIGAVAPGTAYPTAPVTVPTTYVLTVTNAAGQSSTVSALVAPQAAAMGPVLVAGGNATVSAGLTRSVSAAVTGAQDTRVNWSATGGSFSAAVTASGDATVWTAPAATGSCTLTATAAADGTTLATATLTVVALPRATGLAPSTTSPLYGAPVLLTPAFDGGTGSVDQGVGPVTSGVAKASAPLTAPATFTLTVANAAGQSASTASPLVTPQAAAISPILLAGGNSNVSTGLTRGASATVTGAADTTVNWTATGGSFAPAATASGVVATWTAPAVTGSYTLTATAAANGTVLATAPVSVVALPSASALTASTTSPLYGAPVTLTPTFANGTGVIDPGLGAVTSGTPKATSSLTAPATFTLTVTNPAGQTDSRSLTVTPQAVAISPVAVAGGNSNVSSGFPLGVSASVTGAVTTSVNWTATGGSFAPATTASGASSTWTAPGTPGTYTLTATAAADGTTLATTTVTVVALPTATGLTPSTASPLYGAAVTLTPAFANGVGGINQGIGTVTSGTAYSTPSLLTATTYTLTVTNAAGQTATTAATVTPQTVAVGAIANGGGFASVGLTRALSATAANAADTSLDWTATGGSFAPANTASGASTTWTAPASAGSVTLTATSAADASKKVTTTVTVVALPTAAGLTASTTSPLYGATVTLTPTFANGTGSVDHGVGTVTSGTGATSGSLTVPTTFTLTSTNQAGQTASATSPVVTPQAVLLSSIILGNANVSVNLTTTAQATVTGALTTTVNWTATGGSFSLATTASGANTTWTAPASAGTYTLTATAAADGTTLKTAVVTVVALPTATSLTASSTTPLYGATVTLTPVFANGTGVVDQAIGSVATATAYPTAALISATTYTLTVTNAAGQTATRTVTVTPQTVAVGAIANGGGFTSVGLTRALSATAANAVDTSLNWTATGGSFAPANTATGASTTWTAPASAGSVTLTATSAADASKKVTTTITVVAQPTATGLTASSTSPLYGATVTLTPAFAGGTGSVDHGVGTVTSGTGKASLALTVPTTFTLTSTNQAGQTAIFASPLVTPQTVAVSAITLGNGNVSVNLTTTAQATVTGALTTTVNWTTTGGSFSLATTASGANTSWTAPAAAGTYTLTATAAADGTTLKTAVVTVVALPTATSLAASSTTPLYGATVTLTPVFANGTGAVDQAIGTVATATAYPTAALVSATTYTLTVTNAAGQTATRTVTVTPQIVAVGAIANGGGFTSVGLTRALSATAANAVDTSLNWTATGGSFAPANTASGASTTWTAPASAGSVTLTATSAADASKKVTTTITVVALPTATGLTASTTSPLYGATVTLTPAFTGGTGTVDHGVGTVTSGTGATSGALTVPTTFTLTATNQAGQTATFASPLVTPQTVAVSAVTLGCATVSVGYPTTAKATVTGAATATVNWTATGGSFSPATTGSGVNTTWTAPASAGTCTLTAVAAADGTTVSTTTVTVVALPTATSLTASTTSPLYGATVTLTPVFANGTGSINQGIGAVTTATAYPTAALTAGTTYTLTVTNPAGQTATTTATVTPQAVSVGAIANGGGFTSVGLTRALSETAFNAADTSLNWTATGGTFAPANTVSGASTTWTAPASAGSVTLTAASAADPARTASTTISVVALPTATGLTASTTSPLYGATVTLTPTFANGTGSVDQGVGTVTSGTGKATPALTVPTTFTLTATNQAGQTATSASPLVTPQTVAVGAPAGTYAVLTTGDAQTYSATVTGALNGAVIWTATGGTWSGNTWTATAQGTFTITATSAGDPSKSNSTTVKVVDPPQITSFVAADPLVSEGDPTTLHAVFANGALGTATIGTSGTNSTQLTAAAGNNVDIPTGALAATTTFTLTVANEAGRNTVASLTVTVVAGSFTPTVPVGGARYAHTSTALPDGRVLIAGGRDGSGALNSSQVFDPTVPAFSDGGNLVIARFGHTATLLPDGTVLLAGGDTGSTTALAERWNGAFTATGSLKAAREKHTATLLPNGKVLIVGGLSGASPVVTAELYDPSAGTFTYTAGNLNTARYSHTATLLSSGKVLVAGGTNGSITLKSAELFDPATGAFTVTGSMTAARQRHAAVLLDDGRVAMIAGQGASVPLATAETFTVATGTFTAAAGTLASARDGLTATLMAGGQVIVAGGVDGSGVPVKGCEVFTPAAGTFGLTGLLATPRYQHTATLLQDGRAILVGGLAQGGSTNSAEFLDAQDGLQPVVPSAAITAPVGAFRAQTGLAASVAAQGHVTYVWMITGGAITAGQGTAALAFNMPATGTATLDALVTSDRFVPSHQRFVVTPKPVITSFSAAKATVTAGAGTTLGWTVLDADSLSIDQGLGAVTGASTAVTVGSLGTTTYTLTATNAGGSVTAATAIQAVPPPVAVSLTPALNPVPVGGNTTLTPVFSQGTGVIDHGIGAVASGPAYPTAAISTAATFTLTVTNAAGDTAAATASIGLQAVAVTGINGNAYVTSGRSADYTATVTGAVDTSATWTAAAGTMVAATGHFTAPSGHPYDQTQTPVDLTATSTVSGASQLTRTIQVVPLPVVASFLSTPATCNYGSSTTITPVFTLGTGQILGLGSVASGQAVSTGTLTASRSYTLRVTNVAGDYVDQVLTVNQTTLSVSVPSPAGTTHTSGDVVAFTATTLGSATTAVTWTADGGTWNGASWTAPATPGTYTVTAHSVTPAGASASTTVTVVAAPTSSFTADAHTVSSGGAANLTATFAVDAGGTVLVNPGGIIPASGVPFSTGPLAATTTYTLTVTNSAGFPVVRTITVTVVKGIFSPSLNNLTAARTGHTVTLLSGGDVLVAGGDATGAATADRFAYAGLAFSALPAMLASRTWHSATLLANGKVLLAGGVDAAGHAVATAEIFDPSNNTFTLAGGTLSTPRSNHAAGLLEDGRVLLAGGLDAASSPLSTTDIYDPVLDTFTAGPALGSPASWLTATPLANGKLLVAGGDDAGTAVGTGQLLSGVAFGGGLNLAAARAQHTATLLPGGNVLVAGGRTGSSTALAGLEVYSGAFAATAHPLETARYAHTADVLASGLVLVAGGRDAASSMGSAQMYDPGTQLLWTTGSLGTSRCLAGSTILPSGKVLVAGGSTDPGGTTPLATAELFDAQDGLAAAVPGATVTAPASASPNQAGLTASVPNQGGFSYFWSISGGTITGGLGTRAVTFTMGASGSAVLHALVASDRKVPAHGTATVAMAPSIAAFTVLPAINTAGLSSTLAWTVTGGSGLALSVNQGVGSVTGLGSTLVTVPGANTTYTLTATDVNGTTNRSVTLTSVPMPTASSLTAALNPIEKGSSTTIWPVFATNAGGSAGIDNGVGTVLSGVAYPTGTLNATTTFTLSAVNSIGTAATRTLAVTVMPVVVAAPAGPTQVTVGFTSATYGAAVTGAVDKSVAWSVSPAGSIDASGRLTAPATPQDVVVTATSNADPAQHNQVTVHVVPVAVATSITAAANPVLYGDVTTITPHFSQGTAVIDQGIGAVTNGAAYATGAITSPKTFTLTVTNPAGDLVTYPLTVSPQAVVVSAITGPASGKVTQDRSASFSASVTGALATSLAWSASAGSWSGATWTAPHATGTCTITATAVNGSTNTLQVTVVAAPAISAFAGTPPGVNRLQASTLTATFTGAGTGANASGTVIPGSFALATGPGGVATGPLAATQAYTLTVTNDAGDSATASATVQVFLGAFTDAGSGLAPARNLPTATPLPGGDVLMAGGGTPPSGTADRFGIAQMAFLAPGALDGPRSGHTATLLPDGRVLVAGGSDGSSPLATAALYDPAGGTTTTTGAPKAARQGHSALLLDSGKVLLAGGTGPLATAELYDPATGTFAFSGSMGTPRENPTLSRLPDGRVLVAGGWSGSSRLLGAEIYDPSTGTFSPTGNLLRARRYHTATTLPSGLILMAGGTGDAAAGSAEVFNPTLMRFVATGDLLRPRQQHTATVLAGGMVLVAGGNSGSTAAAIDQAELYDPSATAFQNTDFAGTPASAAGAAPLPTGQVLVAGGTSDGTTPVAGARLYTPTDGLPMAAADATITAPAFVPQAATAVPAHVTAASGCRYVWQVTGGTLASGQGTASITLSMPASGNAVVHVLVLTDRGVPSHASVTVTGEPSPQITGFTALANPVPYGGSTSITPVFSNGTGTSVIGTGAAGSLDVAAAAASGVPVAVGPFTAPVQFRLTVTNRAGVSASQTLTVGVQAVIVSPVTPANPTVTEGYTRTFSASVAQAVDAAVLWGATGGTWSGSTWTAPGAPGTYTITATADADRTTFSSTTATVVAAPSGSLAAAANPVPYGAPASLTPTFPAGNSAMLGSAGQDSADVSASAASGGSYASAPLTATGNFTLTVTNAAGTKATAGVTVAVQPVTISAITGASHVTVNTLSTYAATIGGAANGAVAWSSSPAGLVNASTGVLSAPAAAQDVTLTAASSALGTVTSTFVVHVAAAPTGSLAAAANPVPYGGTTNLTPTFPAGTTAVLGTSGQDSTDVSAGAASATAYPVGPLTSATPFTLTVSNAAGARFNVVLTVNVQTVALSAITGPASGKVTQDLAATFSASVTGALDPSVTWSASAGTWSGAAWTAPHAVGPCTITATAVNGSTRTLQVTVVGAPSIAAFGGTPPGVNRLQASTLTATFTGAGTTANGTVTPGNLALASGAGGVSTGPLAATQTYTLTVTNDAGDTATASATVQVFRGAFRDAGSGLTPARNLPTATPLPGGDVLVAGGGTPPSGAADRFGLAQMAFLAPGALDGPRAGHSATLLPDGRVLLAGGTDGSGPLATAALYDPADGTTTVTGTPTAARTGHGALLLDGGRVLLAGGAGPLGSAELYDPAAGTFTSTGSLGTPRENPTLSRLPDGRILVAGGWSGSSRLQSAEIYDPVAGAFTPAADMLRARRFHSATPLPSGLILMAGGTGDAAAGSAEVFDPSLSRFVATGDLLRPRQEHTATLLAGGMVLLAGGNSGSSAAAIDQAELYDPGTTSFLDTDFAGTPASGATAAPLATGQILVAGGTSDGTVPVAGARLYTSTDDLTLAPADASITAPAYVVQAATGVPAQVPAASGCRYVWMVTGGTLVSGQGAPAITFDMPSSGNATLHVLVLTDRGVPAHATVTVAGEPAPQINGFTALANPVPYGGSATLMPVFANGLAGSVIGTGGAGSSDVSAAAASGAPVVVGPLTAPVQYSLTVTNRAGVSTSQTLAVGVQVVTISAITGPSNVTVNAGASFSATVGGAANAAVAWSSTPAGLVNASTGQFTAPAAPQDVTLTAASSALGTVATAFVVHVVLAPTASLDAAANPVPYGGTTTLTPTFPAGTTATLGRSGPGSTDVSAGAASGMGYPTGPLASATTYTLTVTNTAGATASCMLIVNVEAATVAAITGPAYVSVNDAQTYATTVSGAANTALTWSSNPAGLVNAGSGLFTAPATAQDVTLTAASTAEGSVTTTFTVHVVELPAISGFAASPARVEFGQAANLTPAFTGSAARIGTAGPGSSDLTASASSGAPASTGPLHATTSFTLTVSNEAGATVSGTAQVVVNFSATGAMALARQGHTTTLLADGSVLVAGGTGFPDLAERYLAGTFSPTAQPMVAARAGHTATLLADGRVLLAGGADGAGTVQATAELFDPADGSFTATGSLAAARRNHAAALLPDGRVLVLGGSDGSAPLASAELYDPATGLFSVAGALLEARDSATATVLANGDVLATGGFGASRAPLADAETFSGGAFGSSTIPMRLPRARHTATLLPGGQVLLVGGASGSGPAQEAAELYDPSQGTFALAAGPLAMGRERHTATLLANGRVLIAGGTLDGLTPLATAQVFDPASGTFADSGSLGTPRFGAGATLQRDGTVLVTGGTGAGPAALAGAELFDAQDGLVPALPVPALAAPATALFGSTAAASATVPAGGRCVWAIVNGTLTGGAGTPAITFTLGAGGSTRVRVLVLSGVGLAVAEERVVVGN